MVRKAHAAKLETAPDPNMVRMSSDPRKGDSNVEACRLPFDFPAYLTAYRLVEEGENRSLTGWTFEVDCFTMGVVVYVRIDRVDGTLKVFAKDSGGTEKLCEWTK